MLDCNSDRRLGLERMQIIGNTRNGGKRIFVIGYKKRKCCQATQIILFKCELTYKAFF